MLLARQNCPLFSFSGRCSSWGVVRVRWCSCIFPNMLLPLYRLPWSQQRALDCRLGRLQIFFWEPIITFDTKFTMALAGCSGSCSANRWHTLSVGLPCFFATNPNTLQWAKWKYVSEQSDRQMATSLLWKQKKILLEEEKAFKAVWSGGENTKWDLCSILFLLCQRSAVWS